MIISIHSEGIQEHTQEEHRKVLLLLPERKGEFGGSNIWLLLLHGGKLDIRIEVSRLNVDIFGMNWNGTFHIKGTSNFLL